MGNRSIGQGLPVTEEQLEQELLRLLDRFEALHANTLMQLDRTDAALDMALAHFGRSRPITGVSEKARPLLPRHPRA